ncbi:MAG TPA: hypothetical protein VL422_17980, partial [Miltoncostaea sp.]|nr:hypothetical protein [Miltoncostaea sp.]
ASNAVIYGEEYTLTSFRNDIVFGVAGAAGGRLAEETVGVIAGAVAADTAQAAGQATTKAGVATTLAREADQAAGLAVDASRLAAVGREAANILGGAAAVTAVGGTGQFDPSSLAQAAFMSIVGKFAPGARAKPGEEGAAHPDGPAAKDLPGGPASGRGPRDAVADQAAGEMGHPGAGLRSGEAIANVADHAAKLPAPPAGTSLETYAAQVLAPVGAELQKLGAAVPKIEVRDFGNPDRYAIMDFSRNVIVLNEGAMDGRRRMFDMSSAEGRQNILSLVYHEARHAEQMFHALRARKRFHPNPAEAPVIHGDVVDPAIVAAADAHPLPEGRSMDSEMGRRAYDEYFGADTDRYHEGQDEGRKGAIREDIQRLRDDRARIMEQVKGVYSKLPTAKQREVQDLNRRMRELETQLDRLDDVYWRLYVEVDARGAEADLVRELAPARQAALEKRFKEATDGLEGLRASAGKDDQAAIANLVAAMRNYQREMEKLRSSLPKPPDPAPTGGTGGGTR